MSETRSCEQCGAALAAGARFCEICGTPLAPIASAPPEATPPVASAPAPAAPPASPPAVTPPRSSRGMLVGLGIVGVIVVLGCLAVAAFGFWFLQSKPAAPVVLPVSTPQVVVLPSRVEPTVGAPRATTQPVQSIATAAPTPMPTLPIATAPPTQVPGILFDDDFSSKAASESKGWTFTSNSLADSTWSANQLSVSLKEKDAHIRNFPGVEYDDFGVEIEARLVDGNYAEYSIAFRDNKADHRSAYSFGVTTKAEYFMQKTIDGKEVRPRLVEYTSSPLIKTGQGRNTLGVIVKGSLIELYINRTQVWMVSDSSITGKGRVGLEAYTDQSGASVAFSRFTIYTPDQALATWCPPPAPFPAGILFEETFNSQRVAACNHWNSGKSGYAVYSWGPNAFTVSVKQPNGNALYPLMISGREYSDFALETEAQPLDANVYLFGLVFRFGVDKEGKSSYYRFGLVQDGRYALGKRVANEWQTVVDYTASPAIKTGKNRNILGVIVQGSKISLYVNRTLVKNLTDDTIKGSGYIGGGVANGTEVPAAASFSRVSVLTPEKAMAEWGGAPIPSSVPSAAPRATAPIAPGLYVTGLRLEPAPPKRGPEIGFYATFLNTTTGEQSVRWAVHIYRADSSKNSFGETSTATMTMPVGQKELKSLGSWKLTGGGGCEDFVARVAAKDSNNQVTFFNKPDAALFELPFQVCP